MIFKVLTFIGLGLLKRVFFFLLAWVAAPSIIFVLVAWMFLHDSDFSLWLSSYKPDNSRKEEKYFTERVCWITGASSGIGKSLATLLSERGAYVILSGRNESKLQTVADECSRSYLVRGIRTCRRSESGIANAIAEASDEENPRAFVLPFDLSDCDVSKVKEIVDKAVAWRGRVDCLFNNGGAGERAICPPASAEEQLFHTNCLSHIYLTKALLPSAFQPLETPNAPKPSIVWRRMESKDLRDVARSVGELMRSASAVGIQHGTDVVSKTTIGRSIRQWIVGDNIEYNRTFHIVNTSSIFARIPRPGSATYSAAKVALTTYCDILQKEARGLAHEGKHKTEVVVTNVLPGQVGTSLLQNCILSNGELAKDDSDAMSTTGNPITPARCAELIIRATVNKLNECWISRQPHMTHIYAQYYVPWLWRLYSSRWLELPSYDRVVEYNEQLHDSKKGKNGQESDKKNV